jgi:hypothetical protein
MLYGLLVRHLHDERQMAPFQVEGIIKPRNNWGYLVFWGVAGVALGSLLPWVDTLWEENLNGQSDRTPSKKAVEEKEAGAGADWTPVVRSVGAFVGIAFAIVRLSFIHSLRHTDNSTEKAPLDFDPPSITDTSPCQPGSLVHY